MIFLFLEKVATKFRYFSTSVSMKVEPEISSRLFLPLPATSLDFRDQPPVWESLKSTSPSRTHHNNESRMSFSPPLKGVISNCMGDHLKADNSVAIQYFGRASNLSPEVLGQLSTKIVSGLLNHNFHLRMPNPAVKILLADWGFLNLIQTSPQNSRTGYLI